VCRSVAVRAALTAAFLLGLGDLATASEVQVMWHRHAQALALCDALEGLDGAAGESLKRWAQTRGLRPETETSRAVVTKVLGGARGTLVRAVLLGEPDALRRREDLRVSLGDDDARALEAALARLALFAITDDDAIWIDERRAELQTSLSDLGLRSAMTRWAALWGVDLPALQITLTWRPDGTEALSARAAYGVVRLDLARGCKSQERRSVAVHEWAHVALAPARARIVALLAGTLAPPTETTRAFIGLFDESQATVAQLLVARDARDRPYDDGDIVRSARAMMHTLERLVESQRALDDTATRALFLAWHKAVVASPPPRRWALHELSVVSTTGAPAALFRVVSRELKPRVVRWRTVGTPLRSDESPPQVTLVLALGAGDATWTRHATNEALDVPANRCDATQRALVEPSRDGRVVWACGLDEAALSEALRRYAGEKIRVN